MVKETTVAAHRAGMMAELFKTQKKVPAAEIWRSMNSRATQEPLHDVLKPSGKVVEALKQQELTYTGLATKFLQPLGNTTVHLVPYHEGQPDIAHGFQRAECGAHENGWYATVNIRTMDDEPDTRFIKKLRDYIGVDVAARDGGSGRVLVTLSYIVAAEMGVYTISLIDTELLKLRVGRAMVNRVACELLVSKEISTPELARLERTNELLSALMETQ